MQVRNLTSTLKNATSGWVAIDNKNQVVVKAKSFASLCKKVEKIKKELIMVPAAKNYFGFVTFIHE